MKLYFSDISQEGQPQNESRLSLGGYCSSTMVPSGQLNALFSEVSTYTLEKNRKEYIFLVIKNEFENVVKHPQLWIEKDDSHICNFKFAIVEPMPSGEFESTQSPFNKPLYAEFYTANGIEDAIEMSPIDPGDMLGLWIERSIDSENPQVKNRNNCDYLYENYDLEVDTVEKVSLKIEWVWML